MNDNPHSRSFIFLSFRRAREICVPTLPSPSRCKTTRKTCTHNSYPPPPPRPSPFLVSWEASENHPIFREISLKILPFPVFLGKIFPRQQPKKNLSRKNEYACGLFYIRVRMGGFFFSLFLSFVSYFIPL